jgi:hypothetical protein
MAEGLESPLMTKEQAAEYLKMKLSTLHWRRCAKKGPAYRKVGRNVFYHQSDLDAFLEQCRVDPISARD